jgi:superfamily II DNA or RNA helicase
VTTITIFNLSVRIETDDYTLLNHIKSFLKKYYTIYQRGFNQNSKPDIKVFASQISKEGIYYLHINQFAHLYHYLTELNYSLDNVTKIDNRDYNEVSTDFKIRPKWKPREDQKPAIEFLTTNPVKSKMISLKTGEGKTFISMYSIGKLKKRLALVILPTFVDKWVSDIVAIHDAKPEDVMVIRGSKALRGLIDMIKENIIEHNYFIFSNRTLQEYIKEYEKDPLATEEFYGMKPEDLFSSLGVGIVLIDETHMQFHSIFKILLFCNVKYQIGLSATLLSEDPVVQRVHKVVYPTKSVYEGKKRKKYTEVYAIAYSVSEKFTRLIRTTNYGNNNYSHIAFEKSIMKKSFILSKYIEMIEATIDDYYFSEYKLNDKLLIFVSTIKLANILVDRLRRKYNGYKINRYCEEDPYENILNADITVSTVISAGTALDIPDLRVCIQTVNISSPVSNIQSMGRLRELKDRDVKFCYLYGENIPKHKQYHFKRLELFRPLAKNIVNRKSRVNLY